VVGVVAVAVAVAVAIVVLMLMIMIFTAGSTELWPADPVRAQDDPAGG
jgi:hypothetical protein